MPEDVLLRREVLRVQRWLIALMYLPEDHLTGEYDEMTLLAVATFQADMELEITGECDEETYALLKLLGEAALATPTPTPEVTTSPSPSTSPSVSPSAGTSASRSSSGSSASSGSASTAEKKEWLNGVTPGTALTSGHTRGRRDMTVYGSIDAGADDLGIELAGDYVRSLSGVTLTLTGQGGADGWHFNGAALRTLFKSGVRRLSLNAAGSAVTLDTLTPLSGSVYAGLRARGCTDNTFTYFVSGGEIAVLADGKRYATAPGPGGSLTLIEEE